MEVKRTMRNGILACKRSILLSQGSAKELQLLQTFGGHPFIIKLLDFKKTREHVVLYEECHPRTLLDAILKGVDLDGAKKLLVQMIIALQAIHSRGYVHRRISGENVRINCDGDIVISNFSSAMSYRVSSGERFSFPDVPRQVCPDGPEFDIWCLGACLLMLVTSSFPFDHIQSERDIVAYEKEVQSSQSYLLSEMDPLLQDLLRRMLETDCRKRISLADILSHSWLRDCQYQVPAPTTPQSTNDPKQALFPKTMKKQRSLDISSRITRQVIKVMSATNLIRKI